MGYLQAKMDELLLKDLKPAEKETLDKATESVQGNEGQGETGEDKDKNKSYVSKKATEKPKKRRREKNDLSQKKTDQVSQK